VIALSSPKRPTAALDVVEGAREQTRTTHDFDFDGVLVKVTIRF